MLPSRALVFCVLPVLLVLGICRIGDRTCLAMLCGSLSRVRVQRPSGSGPLAWLWLVAGQWLVKQCPPCASRHCLQAADGAQAAVGNAAHLRGELARMRLCRDPWVSAQRCAAARQAAPGVPRQNQAAGA